MVFGDTEGAKLIQVERLAAIGFVEEEKDWLFGAEGGASDLAVAVVEVFCRIYNKTDDFSGVDSVFDLILDGCLEVILGLFQAGGID